MKKKVMVFIFLFTGSFFTGSGNELLTYKKVLDIALSQNIQIKIARNNAEIARRNAHIGNAGLLPRLEFSSSASYQEGGTGLDTDEAGTTTNAQIQASYTLFDGLANIFRWKRLRSENRQGNLDAQNLIELELLKVSDAYFSAASAFEQLRIAEELTLISKERLERAQKRSIYGGATTIDVLSAQVDFATDQVTWTQAKFLWDEARRNLNVLLNRDINQPFKVDTNVQFRQDFTLDELKSLALSKNASFLASKEFLYQSELEVKIAKSAFYPRLDLTASYGLSEKITGWGLALNNSTDTTRIGLSLQLNLFDGFNTIIQKKISQINLQNRTLSLKIQQQELEKSIISAFESYRNSLLVLNLEKKVVKAAELNFKRTKELYNLGQVTTTQFREAQINLIRSRSEMTTAKFEAKLREIELKQLTGQLIPSR